MRGDLRQPGRLCLTWLFARVRGPFAVLAMLGVLCGATRVWSQSQVQTASSERVLTTAGGVQGLPPVEAAKHLPVHLIVTVQYYEPTRYTLFVADATGGVYVGLVYADRLPMQRGDLIEVDGETNASFKTDIRNSRIHILGRKGSLPPPRPSTFRELMSGSQDCHEVLIHGIVRAATEKFNSMPGMAELAIQVPGGTVRAYLEDARGVDLDGLIDAEVEVSGVAGGIFNGREQLMETVLYATDSRQLKILKLARTKPQALPQTAIDDVLQTRYVEDRTERVRVRGAVTFYEPSHSVVIQHNGESLMAETRDAQPIELGEVVDVVGFASSNDVGPKLTAAQILSTGSYEAIKPQRVNYDEASSGKFSEGLVTLRGRVLSQLHTEVSDTLVVSVEGHPVTMLLGMGERRSSLQRFEAGTVVDVTGVCHITKTDPWGNAASFLLQMREIEDVTTVANASWWTVNHLFFLLLGLLVVSLAATGWAVMLRRRVAAQAERINQSMTVERERGRLLEAINSQTPLPELMEDICGSFEGLVGDVQCSYELLDSCCDLNEEWTVQSPSHDVGVARGSVDVRRTPVFETMMTDTTGAAIGVFRAVGAAKRILTSEERDALMVAASLSNIALNQRRLFERLNFHSTHDPLTGLPNRRLSDMRLDEALSDAKANGLLVGVVYIDVNHFKQVNDVYGHKTGDLYLQAISERLNGKVRSTDLLARIGGDEFLLIASLRSQEDAEMYRMRLQSCFDERFRLEGVVVDGAASMGLAVYPLHGATAEELQRHADMDMYAAKQRRPAVAHHETVEAQRLVS